VTRVVNPAASVIIRADGHEVRVPAGISVAAALADLGTGAFRRSVSGESREPVCGMGTCYECRVTIDGAPHRRACLVLVANGMRIETAAQGEGEREGERQREHAP
jgi:aerobic-type carbon monoxide dehydrogenase small subunit (CoxS/CutS family)